MKRMAYWGSRLTAGFLAILLAVPYAQAATPRQQGTAGQPPQSVPHPSGQSPDTENAPRKSDSGATQPDQKDPDSQGALRSQAPDQTGQAGRSEPTTTPQSETEQQPSSIPQPVGTAAAPFEKTTGVAASRPAGSAIAPAKQRRAHSILIRVSIVVGAAVAIGTVTALSLGSSSRP